MKGEVRLHYCFTTAMDFARRERDCLPRLHAEEQRRYATLSSAKRRLEWLAGRVLLLNALDQIEGMTDPLALRTNADGKTEYTMNPDVHLSVSHSRGLVAVALADAPLGMDVEQVRERELVRQAHRIFATAEATHLDALAGAERLSRFYDYWTLKEALCKATGTALLAGLIGFQFDLRDPQAPRASAGVVATGGPWQFWSGGLPGGWRAAVALRAVRGKDALVIWESFPNAKPAARILEGMLSFAG